MGTVGFEQRVRDLVLDLPHIAAVVIPLLAARSALRVQLANLHKMLLDEVRVDPVCRRWVRHPVLFWMAATLDGVVERHLDRLNRAGLSTQAR